MDLRFVGKVVLVTGSTAGIGFAIARSIAAEGAHVYVNGARRNAWMRPWRRSGRKVQRSRSMAS